MKRSTKAALLSGLIYPGIGHMVLKHYLRGSVLMFSALIASATLINAAIQRAQSIVDRINSGEIPLDNVTIAELVTSSSHGADSPAMDISLLVLSACWLIGIIDSYRLGAAQEK